MGALGSSLDAPLLCEGDSDPGFLIRDVSVFDSRNGDILYHYDVVVDHSVGPKILGVGPTGTLEISADQVIDGRGFTLLPGFVNAHVHAMAAVGVPWSPIFPDATYNLDRWLAAGVTTVYDLGGLSAILADLAGQIERGERWGPHLVHGETLITVPDAHPLPAIAAWMPWPLNVAARLALYVVDSPEEAREAVRQVVKADAPWVKAIRDELPEGAAVMSPEVLDAILDESSKLGVLSVIHVGDDEDARLAVGADLQAHMVYRGPLSEPTVEAMVEADTWVVPTMSGFQSTVELVHGDWTPTPLDHELHPAELLDPIAGDAGAEISEVPAVGDFANQLVEESPHWVRNVGLMHHAGVQLLVGSDAPLPGVLPGSAYHRELDALRHAGVPMDELLQAATFHAARFLEEPVSFGVIEEGLRGDLVLVEGDPLTNPEAVHRVKEVFLSGRRVVCR